MRGRHSFGHGFDLQVSFYRPDTLKRHLLTHSGDKLHNCAQCSKSFGRPENLKRHLLTHSGEKPHKCVQCNYSFTQAGNLKEHIMTHTGVKPHQCCKCGYSSITLADIRRHEMTHSGDFFKHHNWRNDDTHEECTHWRKAIQMWPMLSQFCSVGNLQSHKISHNKEKTFLCNGCNKNFKHQKDLTKHGLRHISST